MPLVIYFCIHQPLIVFFYFSFRWTSLLFFMEILLDTSRSKAFDPVSDAKKKNFYTLILVLPQLCFYNFFIKMFGINYLSTSPVNAFMWIE